MKPLRVWACRCAVLTVLLLLVTRGYAQDLAPLVGPLADRVTVGTSGSWTVAVKEGWLNLADDADAGAVRYYHAPWQGDAAVGRSAGVRVRARGQGSAGLIFGIGQGVPRWFALMLRGDGRVSVLVRTDTSLDEIKTAPLPGGIHAAGELLQISQRGGNLVMLANGALIAEMKAAGAVGDGTLGIAAIGPGNFDLREYGFAGAVTPVATGGDDRIPPAPRPAPGGDDRVPAPRKPEIDTSQVDPRLLGSTGAVLSILFHEYGHFMNGELKLPVTGPEEDVADEFSAMVWVENMRYDEKSVVPMALGGAKLWLFMAREAEKKGASAPWYDEHSPDMRRFGSYVCDLYGAFPSQFTPIMDEANIPRQRRDRCVADMKRRRDAWNTQLRAHRRQGVDADFPGDLPADAKGGRITVEWHPSKTEMGEKLRKGLSEARTFEAMVDVLNKLYVMPRDTKLVFRDCDVENCWYSPNDGTVTMCYEMIVFAIKTFYEHESGGGPQPGPGPGPAPRPPGPQPNPQPGPQPGPQPAPRMNLSQFLVGTWHNVASYPGGAEDMMLILNPDGSFTSQGRLMAAGTMVNLQVAGRWMATPLSGNQFNFSMNPMQWSPQQICPQYGYCMPIPMTYQTNAIEIIDPNTLRSAVGTAKRVK